MTGLTTGRGCPNPNFCWSQGCLGRCNMKDDSLSDIAKHGGYCAKCDTVYDRAHECKGPVNPQYDNQYREAVDSLNKATDKEVWASDPLKVSQDEMDKACIEFDSSNANLGDTKKGYALKPDSVYAKEVWNAAIEAAALAYLEHGTKSVSLVGDVVTEIRKLKK